MALRTLALVLVTAGSAQAAPVPKELKRTDAERMQGVWVVVLGRATNAPELRWYFRGDKLYSGGSNTTEDPGTEFGITLRPELSPAQVDFTKGGVPRGVGIYRFVGEELQFSFVQNGERPKDFESPQKWILKRVPEAKK